MSSPRRSGAAKLHVFTNGEPMFEHILIAADGSPIAIKAAKAGIGCAAETGARATAFHLVRPVTTGLQQRLGG
jgi:nucleotide-binding universal stress UspA family protein